MHATMNLLSSAAKECQYLLAHSRHSLHMPAIGPSTEPKLTKTIYAVYGEESVVNPYGYPADHRPIVRQLPPYIEERLRKKIAVPHDSFGIGHVEHDYLLRRSLSGRGTYLCAVRQNEKEARVLFDRTLEPVAFSTAFYGAITSDPIDSIYNVQIVNGMSLDVWEEDGSPSAVSSTTPLGARIVGLQDFLDMVADDFKIPAQSLGITIQMQPCVVDGEERGSHEEILRIPFSTYFITKRDANGWTRELSEKEIRDLLEEVQEMVSDEICSGLLDESQHANDARSDNLPEASPA